MAGIITKMLQTAAMIPISGDRTQTFKRMSGRVWFFELPVTVCCSKVIDICLHDHPTWQGGLPVGYLQSVAKDLNKGLPRNKSSYWSERGLKPGGSRLRVRAFNHSITLLRESKADVAFGYSVTMIRHYYSVFCLSVSLM